MFTIQPAMKSAPLRVQTLMEERVIGFGNSGKTHTSHSGLSHLVNGHGRDAKR